MRVFYAITLNQDTKEKLAEYRDIDALHKLKHFPKEIDIYKLGSFKRKNKEIVWAGIKKNEELILLQKELRKLLNNSGFSFENRDYTPHITLGRQIVRQQPLENIEFERIKASVKSIALMESKRVDGELVYEEIVEIK
ncbi:RNA 2',3'-cyclic phosphodiesterase [Clostridium sp. DL1XJH146]